MKLHEMMQFKSKIERRKHYFDLPSLPDREWQYMLQRAKMESSKKNEFNPFYAFMCSARLSFALSSAIVLALVLSLLYSNPQDDTNTKTIAVDRAKDSLAEHMKA